MQEFDAAVYIGRFQPPHNAHIASIRHALSIAKKVIVVLGSSFAPRTPKNPWTADERKKMIQASLIDVKDLYARVLFIPQRNYLYNENLWILDLQRKVADLLGPTDKVALVGLHKDASTYYLKQFPQWDLRSPPQHDEMMHATDVRNEMFSNQSKGVMVRGQPDLGAYVYKNVPQEIHNYLYDWMAADAGKAMTDEFNYLEDYKKRWSSVPYPPTFTTVDAVVIRSGHVLMVERKINPGKGLFALPGGFVGQGELIEDAVTRELHEETDIRRSEVTGKLVDSHVFDHPDRSLRGRTITHAFCYDLGGGSLLKVKGGDDAARAFWMPISEVMINSEKIYEDHSDIINFFVNRF